MYDAVYLYALALHETLSEGYSVRNGLEITKKMANKVFEGALNHSVSLLHLSLRLFVSGSASVLLSVCLSVSSVLCLSVCLSVFLPFCLYVPLFCCLSVCLSVCLCVCICASVLLLQKDKQIAASNYCLCVCVSSVCVRAILPACLPVCLSICLWANPH